MGLMVHLLHNGVTSSEVTILYNISNNYQHANINFTIYVTRHVAVVFKSLHCFI